MHFAPHPMRPPLLSILALAVLFLHPAQAEAQSGVDPIHQPVVRRSDYVIDLPVNGGLAPADLRRLDSWLTALAPAYGDSIGIDAGTVAYDEATRAVIRAVLSSYGMPLAAAAPITQGDLPDGHIRVVLSRMTASVPGCPDWSSSFFGRSARQNLSNYGCATNATLAAMVADPGDLLVGRKAKPATLSPVNGRVIEAYRTVGGTAAGAASAPPAPAGASGK